MNMIEAEVLSGQSVAQLPEVVLGQHVEQVSAALSAHQATMLVYQPSYLLAQIKKGWTVLAIAMGQPNQLVGFGQLWPYGEQNGQKVVEFGSWLAFVPGQGGPVLKAAVSLAQQLEPGRKLISVIAADNARAQQAVLKAGAVFEKQKPSTVFKEADGVAKLINFYDLTAIPAGV